MERSDLNKWLSPIELGIVWVPGAKKTKLNLLLGGHRYTRDSDRTGRLKFVCRSKKKTKCRSRIWGGENGNTLNVRCSKHEKGCKTEGKYTKVSDLTILNKSLNDLVANGGIQNLSSMTMLVEAFGTEKTLVRKGGDKHLFCFELYLRKTCRNYATRGLEYRYRILNRYTSDDSIKQVGKDSATGWMDVHQYQRSRVRIQVNFGRNLPLRKAEVLKWVNSGPPSTCLQLFFRISHGTAKICHEVITLPSQSQRRVNTYQPVLNVNFINSPVNIMSTTHNNNNHSHFSLPPPLPHPHLQQKKKKPPPTPQQQFRQVPRPRSSTPPGFSHQATILDFYPQHGPLSGGTYLNFYLRTRFPLTHNHLSVNGHALLFFFGKRQGTIISARGDLDERRMGPHALRKVEGGTRWRRVVEAFGGGVGGVFGKRKKKINFSGGGTRVLVATPRGEGPGRVSVTLQMRTNNAMGMGGQINFREGRAAPSGSHRPRQSLLLEEEEEEEEEELEDFGEFDSGPSLVDDFGSGPSLGNLDFLGKFDGGLEYDLLDDLGLGFDDDEEEEFEEEDSTIDDIILKEREREEKNGRVKRHVITRPSNFLVLNTGGRAFIYEEEKKRRDREELEEELSLDDDEEELDESDPFDLGGPLEEEKTSGRRRGDVEPLDMDVFPDFLFEKCHSQSRAIPKSRAVPKRVFVEFENQVPESMIFFMRGNEQWVDIETRMGYSPLHFLVVHGDNRLMKRFVEDVKKVGKNGERGKEFLGKMIEKRDKWGNTALHLAYYFWEECFDADDENCIIRVLEGVIGYGKGEEVVHQKNSAGESCYDLRERRRVIDSYDSFFRSFRVWERVLSFLVDLEVEEVDWDGLNSAVGGLRFCCLYFSEAVRLVVTRKRRRYRKRKAELFLRSKYFESINRNNEESKNRKNKREREKGMEEDLRVLLCEKMERMGRIRDVLARVKVRMEMRGARIEEEEELEVQDKDREALELEKEIQCLRNVLETFISFTEPQKEATEKEVESTFLLEWPLEYPKCDAGESMSEEEKVTQKVEKKYMELSEVENNEEEERFRLKAEIAFSQNRDVQEVFGTLDLGISKEDKVNEEKDVISDGNVSAGAIGAGESNTMNEKKGKSRKRSEEKIQIRRKRRIRVKNLNHLKFPSGKVTPFRYPVASTVETRKRKESSGRSNMKKKMTMTLSVGEGQGSMFLYSSTSSSEEDSPISYYHVKKRKRKRKKKRIRRKEVLVSETRREKSENLNKWQQPVSTSVHWISTVEEGSRSRFKRMKDIDIPYVSLRYKEKAEMFTMSRTEDTPIPKKYHHKLTYE